MHAYLVHTKNCPILRQLELEEAFLRTQNQNLIWINEGSSEAAVLGISSKVDELIDEKKAAKRDLLLIRRYSGGGTVVVDNQTLFVSFIFNLSDFNLPAFPSHIMDWSAKYYAPFLKDKGFELRENDYTILGKKFGGNAQYLTKNRFVHHSTLLYDFNEELMQVLLQPKKAPSYRNLRSHFDFLTTLKSHFSTMDEVVENLVKVLKTHFILEEKSDCGIEQMITQPYRKATQVLNLSSAIF